VAQITIADLNKSYGPLHVVKNFTLHGKDKEFVTLLGPSGCGKTTVLRLIAGFLKPDSGEILVDGRLLSSPLGVVSPERRGMGMVFQSYALWPHMTVFENVAFGLRIKRLSQREISDRVDRVMTMVRMAGLGGKYPGVLSGGQQQRVALARSLVTEPSILLLDEPLSNLDARLREQMRAELKALQRQTDIAFVYVTHDQVEAMTLSDRVAVLWDGVLQQFAPPREVYDHPANKFVAEFVGSVNFIEVRIDEPAGASDSRGSVVLGVGARLAAILPQGLGKGSTVTLAVRPEDVRLSLERPIGASNVLRGSILDRLFLGNLFDYRVDVGGITMRAIAPREHIFALGEEVYMHIDPDRCLAMA
jgi:ABC-type Fe3+/spermidine/putrescine transport system ATPase subunit